MDSKNDIGNACKRSYDKRRNKWRYQLRIGKITKTKQFDTEKEAAIKRDEFILNVRMEICVKEWDGKESKREI